MNKIILFLGSIVFLFLAASCAKIGSPSGGPKDTLAPVVAGSRPINYSTNYNRKKVVIKFNEFVTLKDQYTEFTVSPPLEKKPTPQIKGRNIVFELPASLLDSFTYTFDFGESIADINEGNKFPNFQFVVTKLEKIDSFAISGKVLDAFTRQPDKERISVFLYTNLSDTAPYTIKSAYMARTNPQGEFAINHVAPGKYAVFALKDSDNNMLYNMPAEVIAFSNDILVLSPDSIKVALPVNDSIREKSKTESGNPKFFIENDTVNKAKDTINENFRIVKMYGYSINLSSFTEKEPYKQYLVEYSRKQAENFTLIFNEPVDSTLPLTPLNFETTKNWYYLQHDPEPDTLVYWITDTALVKKDSLLVEAVYPVTDSTGENHNIVDTLVFRNKSKEAEPEKEKSKGTGLGRLIHKDKEEQADTLPKKEVRMTFVTNINKSAHDLNLPLRITANTPVLDYDSKLYKVIKFEDTLEIPVKSKFISNTNDPRIFDIPFELEPYTRYRIDLYQGLFRDIYYHTIDSTSISFTTQRDDFYGSIKINFENVHSPVIVQLLGSDSKVVKQQIITSDQKVVFDYLKPGKFSLKIIDDDNNNGKWDTGDYKLKIQPEKTDYFPQVVDVRSNWEVEYTWEVKW